MTVRWGIVSAGKICSDFVNAINSYPGSSGVQVVAAVAARDRSRAEQFAQLHGIPNVFDSYQAMAESSGVIYATIIKPLTHCACNRAYEITDLDAGKLGEVKLVDVNFGFPIDTVDRLSKKSLGGGAVLDLGVYVLQFTQFIFNDEPTKVTALGALNEEGVDTRELIVLEYTGGRRAVLNVDATMQLWNIATVTGTKGHARLEEPFHFPNSLVHVDGTVENFKLHSSKIPFNFTNSAGLVYESLEVVRCIKEGLLESPRVSHRDSLIIAKIQDSVRKQLGVHYDVDDQEFS